MPPKKSGKFLSQERDPLAARVMWGMQARIPHLRPDLQGVAKEELHDVEKTMFAELKRDEDAENARGAAALMSLSQSQTASAAASPGPSSNDVKPPPPTIPSNDMLEMMEDHLQTQTAAASAKYKLNPARVIKSPKAAANKKNSKSKTSAAAPSSKSPRDRAASTVSKSSKTGKRPLDRDETHADNEAPLKKRLRPLKSKNPGAGRVSGVISDVAADASSSAAPPVNLAAASSSPTGYLSIGSFRPGVGRPPAVADRPPDSPFSDDGAAESFASTMPLGSKASTKTGKETGKERSKGASEMIAAQESAEGKVTKEQEFRNEVTKGQQAAEAGDTGRPKRKRTPTKKVASGS